MEKWTTAEKKNNKSRISAKPKQKLTKPRKYLTIGQKQQIIELWKSGQETAEQLANKFDSSLSAIYRIIGLKEDLSGTNSNRKYLRAPPHRDLEDILIDWINTERSKNRVLSSNAIIEKAKIIHRILKEQNGDIYQEFEGSYGWLRRFKSRKELKDCNWSGESVSADQEDSDMEDFVIQKINSIKSSAQLKFDDQSSEDSEDTFEEDLVFYDEELSSLDQDPLSFGQDSS